MKAAYCVTAPHPRGSLREIRDEHEINDWVKPSPLPDDDKILIGFAGARSSPRSHVGFLCRHQAVHYRASSWDHSVISSAICLDSFFVCSHSLLRLCFANLQFTCQTALVERLLWVSEGVIALIRELVRTAGTEQSTRLLFGSVDAISSVQALALSPQAGLPPGQGSHLLSLGNVRSKSLQLSDAGNVPPAIPDCALLQSRRCPLSPRAHGKHKQ